MNTPLFLARAAAGVLVWILLALFVHDRLADPLEGRDRQALRGMRSYLLSRRLPVVLRFPEEVEIAVGDPVYSLSPEGSLILRGEVDALLSQGNVLPLIRAWSGDGVREARCSIRCGAGTLPGRGARARLVQVPQDAAWVLRTLLPPEKLKVIADEWNQALLKRREEIFEVLSPVLRAALPDIEKVLAEDLPPALAARRGELAAIGRRFQEEVVEGEFTPLLQDELWPIIQHRVQPTLDAIGTEVWQRLPLWSLTWRFLYQALPLTSGRQLKREVDRFWSEETLPILKAHAPDFLGILKDIVQEAASNSRVSEAFRRSFERLLEDRQLQHELRLLFMEVVLDNTRLQEVMARHLTSPEATRTLEVLAGKLEPMVRWTGDMVLGTRGGGITPELARVLRTQILEKDRRWILLELGGSEAAGGGRPGGGSAGGSGSISGGGAGGGSGDPGPDLPLAPGSVIPAEVERR